MEEVMRIREAAIELKCTGQTIRNYIERGLIRKHKVGGKVYLFAEDIKNLKKIPNFIKL